MASDANIEDQVATQLLNAMDECEIQEHVLSVNPDAALPTTASEIGGALRDENVRQAISDALRAKIQGEEGASPENSKALSVALEGMDNLDAMEKELQQQNQLDSQNDFSAQMQGISIKPF